jgi:hypothetical protein
MIFSRAAVFAVVVASLFLIGSTPPALGQQTAVSIQQAIKEGKVEVKVSSLGGATGSTVRVDVRRKVPRDVHVEITPGTVFLSPEGSVQNMAGGVVKGEFNGPNTYQPTNTNVVVLADDAWHGYLLESFCMDFHKGPPQRGLNFNLTIQDQRTARIIRAAKQDPNISPWALQFALWMDREGIPENELLSRYGHMATEVDVRVARDLIKKAEQAGVATVPADMPANVSVQVKKLFSPDPAVRASAVKVLVGMGKGAESAAPFLANNVATTTPGQLSHSTWVNILTNPHETNVTVDQAGLADLKALVDAMRERREARQSEGKERKPGADRPHPLRDRLRERNKPAADAK